MTAAVYEVMIATKEMHEYELQVVAAQDRIAMPEHYFSATQLINARWRSRLSGVRLAVGQPSK